jgi:hypothetical protein
MAGVREDVPRRFVSESTMITSAVEPEILHMPLTRESIASISMH